MSITFSGTVISGDSDTQSSLKGSATGQGNAIFSNFSSLLTSIAGENKSLELSSETVNVRIGDFEEGALGNVSAQEFIGQIIGNDFINVDRELENLVSEQGFEGLVSHLEGGGDLDGSVQFKATAAFVEQRLGVIVAEPISGESSGSLTLTLLAELFAAVDPSGRPDQINAFKNDLSDQNLLNKSATSVLNDLMVGVPTQLELNDTDPSSILFDIRDLKNDLVLGEVSGEILIPQIVPINVEHAHSKNDTYDPFIAVKVGLLDLEADFGSAGFIELPSHPDLELGSGIVGLTRTVEIDPSVDARSKLLIGLSIPENSDLKNLPDFVRFKISLEKESHNEAEPKPVDLHDLANIANVGSDMKETSGISDVAKQLIDLLQEMSGSPSNRVQIVTKTAPDEATMPSFDMQRVSISEMNKLLLNPDSNDAISLEKQLKSDIYYNNGMIIDKEVKLVASMNIDTRARATSSVIALDAELKFFYKNKDDKNYFNTKYGDNNLVEQKNVSNSFNPKSFLEAAEVLRMKPISFSTSAPKFDHQVGVQSEVVGANSAKTDVQTPVQSGSPGNSNGFASSLNSKISLYDAQYASRISMLVVDKVLSGKENFEIHLEPESFGKIKVNVLMDKQSLDIRMVAETQAAASLLRANEDSLLQITNQNGMKLASFSVGMQSGADQQKQNSNQNRNRVTGQANSMLERTKIQNSPTSTSYRTPTGLNLIA